MPEHVEEVLLETAGKVESVLETPKSCVWMTDFKDYAVEYTLYVFIDDIKRLREIDADLQRTVFETCKSHHVDISTPTLVRRIKDY